MTDPSTPPPVPADDPARVLTVVDPDDPALAHVGVVSDTYTILVAGSDTAGRYALLDMLIPPAGGPPPHRHDFEEMFHVLDGEVVVRFRGEQLTARAGMTVNIPALAPHHFTNESDRDARLLCMVSPAGLEEYFAAFGETLPSRTAPAPRLSADEVQRKVSDTAELAQQHRIENLPPDVETDG